MIFAFCRQIIWGAMVAVAMSGCATTSTESSSAKTPEQKVAIRAQERWDALRAAQFDKAFSYLTPSTRLTLPPDVFRSRLSSLRWIDVKVLKVVCEPEVCDVTLKMDYYALPNLKDSRQIEEKWIWDAGNWWVVYQG